MDNDNTRASSAASRRTAPHLLSQLPAVQTGPGITITSRDALLFWENHRLRWRLAALSRRKRLATAACDSGSGIVSLEVHLI